MAIETKIHNPSVNEGNWVVSQFLDDEALGFNLRNCNSGIYLIDRIEPYTYIDDEGVERSNLGVILKKEPSGNEFNFDLNEFTRTGILGEERFTVIEDLDVLQNPDAPIFRFNMDNVLRAAGINVDPDSIGVDKT